jgi:hypothetical protein
MGTKNHPKKDNKMTSTMKSNNETNTATAVDERIEALKAARVAWEEGTYKKSNEELYKLLDDCLAFYLDIRSKTNKCKALNALLKARDTSFNEGTSLQTRIVRAVFGAECGKRAYAYARVITVSAVEKRPEVAMYDFITQRGGVEEIRRTKSNGETPTGARTDNISFAIEALEKSAALTTSFAVQASERKAPEDATHTLFVAIMRQEADGNYSMVYETSAKSVVNKALEQAGKDKGAEAEADSAAQQQRHEASDADAAINVAVNAAQMKTAA